MWKFNNSMPIYMQIVEQIKLMIIKEELKPGDKIPTVRELAITAGVNPNTMQKALSELEREGVLYSNRTAGRFVSENKDVCGGMQNQAIKNQVSGFVNAMRSMGVSNEQIINEVKKYFEEESN